jgi:hypothetical protein
VTPASVGVAAPISPADRAELEFIAARDRLRAAFARYARAVAAELNR